MKRLALILLAGLTLSACVVHPIRPPLPLLPGRHHPHQHHRHCGHVRVVVGVR